MIKLNKFLFLKKWVRQVNNKNKLSAWKLSKYNFFKINN